MTDGTCWRVLNPLVTDAEVVVERPAGSPHPLFSECLYPLDDGFLRATCSGDGMDIDVIMGATGSREVTGIVSTLDAHRRDAELRVLLGCTTEQAESVRAFLDGPGSFGCLRPLRPGVSGG
ncbi:inorganic pyrophosphatase [Deinococcus sp.]|uniref:inorganic pyrophosphatase n=1 Tax=Deinococcus sp. TaxID=47478 RepID=UPI002869BAD6|nr:inorganic pyrophosphatase [Deinococcus sp.]